MGTKERLEILKDMIEPIENWQYVSGTRDIGKSYFQNLLDEKDNVINELLKRISNLEFEVERLNNIINELEKCIKDKYYEAIDYQTKIRQSDLMQGDYPVRYYLEEQNEQLCNYFLNRLKDFKELKGSDKE